MSVEFKDHSEHCIMSLCDGIENGLEEVGGEVESRVRKNTRVDTGQLKASWYHEIEDDTCVIGSILNNAIWEEFGTGIYADGGGRQSKWKYEYKGKKGKQGWRVTQGKKKNPKGLKSTAFGMKDEIEDYLGMAIKMEMQ